MLGVVPRVVPPAQVTATVRSPATPYTPFTPEPPPTADIVGAMRYLEAQGLDEAVSAALMKTVNERAKNGRRRVAELLLGDDAPPVEAIEPPAFELESQLASMASERECVDR